MRFARAGRMHQVEIDAAEPEAGEEGFILQLRPPAAPGADEAELALRIEQFARLFLKSADAPGARFAGLAPLTFAIAAPPRLAAEIEALRADLAETLFGADDPERVRLVREARTAEAEIEPAGLPGPIETVEDEQPWSRAQPSAATRAAFSDGDAFDLDAGSLDIVDEETMDLDTWARGDQTDEDFWAEATISAAPRPELADADRWDDDVWSFDSYGQDAAAPAVPETASGSILDALAEIEAAFAADDARRAEPGAGADLSADGADLDFELDAGPEALEADDTDDTDAAAHSMSVEDALAALGACGAEFDAAEADAPCDETRDDFDADAPLVVERDDDVPPPQAFDERVFARDLDRFETVASARAAEHGVMPDTYGDHDDAALESLTETPARRTGPGIAAELAAFRAEMREIAAGIPGGATRDALDRFRSEMDELTGALGQRVDGAAGRVEAAADRIANGAAGRIDAAASRTETSAALVEKTVRDAVCALEALLERAGRSRKIDEGATAAD